MFRLWVGFLVALGLSTVAAAEPSFKTPVSYEEASQRAGEILSKMRMDEKLQLISGYRSFFIRGFPEHGIPELQMSDASGGVNIRPNVNTQLDKSTAFPAPIALAATWDPDLANRYGRSIGEECRAGGIAILLGPGLNLYRNAQCGRNFEYFGEDPWLASRIAERYVLGVLETGTIPTLKHFIGNDTEFHRRTANAIIDERTLHELYLPPFQAAIDAGAMAVMTAYNQLNGEWCGQSEYVINQVLRQDLHFRWLVMSDWWSVWDAEKIVKSGQDLEMPGDKFIQADADRLLRLGRISAAQVDRMAESILRTEIAMGLHDRTARDDYFSGSTAAHLSVALKTSRESIVLLKNDGVLPLRRDGKEKILATGIFMQELARGGGSAEVAGYNNVTQLDALKNRFGERLSYLAEPDDAQIKAADVVLVSTGTRDSEGWDRPFELPATEEKKLQRIVGLNPRVVVVVQSGGGVNMSAWAGHAAAILYGWYPGQIGNQATAEVIDGETNPSGKLPISIERRFEDSPAFGYLPKGETLYSGWGPDNDMGHQVYDVRHAEGVFTGYRWYQAKKIKPLFAFGHGLSYSHFEYSGLRVSPEAVHGDGRVTIEFTVRNTGSVPGAEVAQVYVHSPGAALPRPENELKGFSRVTLNPGEKTVVRMRITPRDLAYWDAPTHAWQTENGEHLVRVGSASDKILLEGSVRLED